ncbi:hypothetical protein FJV41_14470 [Myxococcus llanfairpwllgwyngyllgogerychwyrndrobwllllantysiliogogogochensis]|uniref:Lipoprotein n=1 Tax=Myxococcus llanfairpwllgwyngyllgogerychwyrndrobwllllantysiliogogogochensis TaxID=2590453 RepID=A0A540X1Y2_9BACT|nr:hypothetical protein [Myxococcus llanfairpwllgwyngyllgogerychwyrndrobwllllantysiliogogogochensis]TQF15277.1 hypothetical protein FJV41_14470 [Myxococcus llanfairpwllgwyngyllgogerychwyrndrobwllllantysiliogogogochensis]
MKCVGFRVFVKGLALGSLLWMTACNVPIEAEEETGEFVSQEESSLESPLVPGVPCADGTMEQIFSGGMAGCAGKVTWGSRASLCAPGFRPASAREWDTLFLGLAPAHNYWTNDDLRYSGVSGTCSVSYVTGTACPAGQPMRVCTAAGTDAEGNTCNWTGCGLLANTPNRFFGGCAGNTTAGTLCVPRGCADGSVEQTFSNGMVGCAGSTNWAGRAALCAPGYRVATAAEWVGLHGTSVPTHHYWTNDDLKYTGSAAACYVSATVGSACPAGQPMRVCRSTGTDAEGNTCNWVNCGFGALPPPNQYFGGCAGNPTAGALCVPTRGCADGSVEQVLTSNLVGCSGVVTWPNRNQLCAPGWTASTASTWTSQHGLAAPRYNYWTSDNLRYLGTGSSACAVSTTSGTACNANQPMRLCTPAGTDALGNQCNWTHCGYQTNTPDHYFGGCNGNTTAGTLCRL